ncbi:MAG: hypothetical protein WBO82_07225 [Neisseria sp.]
MAILLIKAGIPALMGQNTLKDWKRSRGRTSAVMLFNGGIETVNDCRRVKQDFSGSLKFRLSEKTCLGQVWKSR